MCTFSENTENSLLLCDSEQTFVSAIARRSSVTSGQNCAGQGPNVVVNMEYKDEVKGERNKVLEQKIIKL